MTEFLSSNLFRFFIIPLGTVALSVFIRITSRNDRSSGYARNDVAVGLDIALIAMVTLITFTATTARSLASTTQSAELTPELTRELEDKLLAASYIIPSLLFGMWGVSTLIRKLGWEQLDQPQEAQPKQPQERLTWLFGVIFPFLYGASCLVFVLQWIGG